MQRKEFIEIEPNIKLHIRDWGQGKPIVFIPGWPLSHEMYEYQFTQLPKYGYRCIGITMRGFGKSSKPYSEYNYDIFADDIKKIFEVLNLRDVTLAGHSMGGAISLHYMARHKGARVAKLALFGAAAPSFTKRPDFPHGVDSAVVDGFIAACTTDRAKLNEDFGKIFFRRLGTVSPKLYEWFYNMGMEASPEATIASLIALRDSDLRDDLSSVKVPTVVFHAKRDKICPFELAEITTAAIDGASLIQFDNSGHGLFYEEKDKFNAALMNFV